MSYIALTGAGGFVGSHIASALIENQHRVLAFLGPDDKYYPKKTELETIDLLNLNDQNLVRKKLSNCEWLIHAAGPSSVAESFYNPDIFVQTHCVGTASIMRIANEVGVPKRIYISSAEVYGASTDYPVTEDECCVPKSPYGAAKYGAEWIARTLSSESSSDLIIVRPFSLYGARMRTSSVMQRIIDQAREGKQIKLHDLAPIRDNLYIEDLASMICMIIERNLKSEMFNVCSGEGVSIGDLAQLISNIFQLEIPILQTSASDRPNDTNRLIGCRDKAYNTLDWKPNYSLTTGIEQMLGIL